MARFAMFVDGSNLYGSLSSMGVLVDDYQHFFRYVVNNARSCLEVSRLSRSDDAADEISRIYWYVVASMDEWDLADAKAQASLQSVFERSRTLNSQYLEAAGRSLAEQHSTAPDRESLMLEAWSRCFSDISTWYAGKQETLQKQLRFHHAIRSSTDFIDVVEAGHWRVDMFGRRVDEKGLDARLAVDMVTLVDTYDIALVISGDADMLPSIRYAKQVGKCVGAVEFLSGYPPEDRGRGFSTKLRLEADFVVQVYEMELVSREVARKRDRSQP